MNKIITKQQLFEILTFSRLKQKSILKIIDSILEITDYRTFSLCEGSLLGAVRHQDFIPWDDDFDIHMTFENFNDLCKKISGSDLILEKSYKHLFYLKQKNNNSKIDIFLENCKDSIYLNSKYQSVNFNKYKLNIPTNYINILNKNYPDWQNFCYITNHKIARHYFNSSAAYKNEILDKYPKIDLSTALLWVEEFDQK